MNRQTWPQLIIKIYQILFNFKALIIAKQSYSLSSFNHFSELAVIKTVKSFLNIYLSLIKRKKKHISTFPYFPLQNY